MVESASCCHWGCLCSMPACQFSAGSLASARLAASASSVLAPWLLLALPPVHLEAANESLRAGLLPLLWEAWLEFMAPVFSLAVGCCDHLASEQV